MNFDMRKTAQPGFTFIEIAIAVIIIGIMIAGAIPTYIGHQKRAKKTAATSMLKSFDTAISTFNIDTHKWPETLEDLVRRPFDETLSKGWMKGGYLGKEEVPEDPWGNEFVYRRTPGKDKSYEIFSYGPNGEEASEDEWIRP